MKNSDQGEAATTPHPTRLLSIPETAEQLRLGEGKTYQLINAGELETVRIGRRRLVKAASIDALIERLSAA